MNVRPFDGTAPEPQELPEVGPVTLQFTPFVAVSLGHSQELRIDLAQKGNRKSVSVRLWRSKGRGRPLVPEHPWHLFPEYLPDLIAALTEAAAAIGVAVPAAPATPEPAEVAPCP